MGATNERNDEASEAPRASRGCYWAGRALLVTALLSAACAIAPTPVFADEDLETNLKRLVEVYAHLEDKLAEPFDPADAFYRGAIPAMVRTLDPHSAFLDPQQFESLREMQRSTEKGFGSILQLMPGRVVVLQTLLDSPSARAGISTGDELVVVNGYRLTELSIQQLAQLLGQSRQNRVELLVKRPSFARLIPITLVPAEMEDPSVQSKFILEEGVAYVKVANFEATTAQELHAAMEGLGGDDLRGLVLDLRDNPGGVIEAAVRMAAFFLEPDRRILWIRGREGPKEEVRVPAGMESYRFPVAVLINEKTASAAELVAGALQDNDRAVLLGTRSFGKGLVQSVFDLSDGSGLALTTALYQSPSGRTIQRSLGDCREFQLAPCVEPETQTYKTLSGHEVPGGGGVEPDRRVYPHNYTRLEAFLEQSSAFFDFAQLYVRKGVEIDDDFQATSALLDDFQLFLSERGVRPTLSDWTAAVEHVRWNLRQEIFNLTLGVEKGDEVELRNDPQVKAALNAVREQLR